MYCTHCGQELIEGGKFCPKCGAPVDGNGFEASEGPQAEPGVEPGENFVISINQFLYILKVICPLIIIVKENKWYFIETMCINRLILFRSCIDVNNKILTEIIQRIKIQIGSSAK